MGKKKKPKPVALPPDAKKWGQKDLIERGDLTFDDIKKALFDTMGNITQAAKLLGRHRDRLSYYFKKYPELNDARKEAIELRREDLKETALGGLIQVLNADLDIRGIPSAKVAAATTLLKLTGDLVEKSEVKSTNLNVEKNLDHMSDEDLDKKLKELEQIATHDQQGN